MNEFADAALLLISNVLAFIAGSLGLFLVGGLVLVIISCCCVGLLFI